MTDRPFKVIDGTPAADTPKERLRQRLRKQPKPGHVIRCHRCTGIEFLETRIGVEYFNGKPRGGQRVLICAICLMQGERVVVP